MPVEITVPSVGESIKDGVIVRWIKQTGEYIRRDEPLFELETEKATTEIPAPASGTVQITVPAGKKVAIGAVVGQIDDKAVAPATSKAAAPPMKDSVPATMSRNSAKPDGVATPAMSPAARVMVAEKGVDPRTLAPTGRGKTIVKDDILAPVPPPTLPVATLVEPPQVTRTRMSPLRQRIAQRLLASQQETATLTSFNEADMSVVMDLRSRCKDAFKEKHSVGLGFMSFFVKAAVDALEAFPVVNSRIEGEEIVTPNYYHIGVAVSSERGLMVPVLRDCNRLSFAQIEKRIAELATAARDGKIRPDDLTGGTFTITNGGVFGSLMSTPILNPPQSAILGMHTIQKRPVVVDDQIVVRPMMYLALSYDHRLIDGREAVLFLGRIKDCIENPSRLLLEL